MDAERIASLEQAISELQARDEGIQQKLNLLIDHITRTPKPSSPPPIPIRTPDPETFTPSPSPLTRGPPPALPSEFDGDRSRGQEFIRSCQTYIRLCSYNFSDDQVKITWTLSYMKSGRAAKWAARVFRSEEQTGTPRFSDWNQFRDEFNSEFCPVHSRISAINRLESTTYFQGKRSLDEYLDEFSDLVTEAGYTDSKTIVVKFRRGLDSRLQDAIATMTRIRLSGTVRLGFWSKTERRTRPSGPLIVLHHQLHTNLATPSPDPFVSRSMPMLTRPRVILCLWT